MSEPPKPTAAELEILQILWTRGPSTVRHVKDTLGASKKVGYTTVLKLLQIMLDKGLVCRDEDRRAHVYSASVEKRDTQQRLVRDLLDRVFAGSSAALVLRALAERPASAEETREIRAMLDDIESAE